MKQNKNCLNSKNLKFKKKIERIFKTWYNVLRKMSIFSKAGVAQWESRGLKILVSPVQSWFLAISKFILCKAKGPLFVEIDVFSFQPSNSKKKLRIQFFFENKKRSEIFWILKRLIFQIFQSLFIFFAIFLMAVPSLLHCFIFFLKIFENSFVKEKNIAKVFFLFLEKIKDLLHVNKKKSKRKENQGKKKFFFILFSKIPKLKNIFHWSFFLICFFSFSWTLKNKKKRFLDILKKLLHFHFGFKVFL